MAICTFVKLNDEDVWQSSWNWHKWPDADKFMRMLKKRHQNNAEYKVVTWDIVKSNIPKSYVIHIKFTDPGEEVMFRFYHNG